MDIINYMYGNKICGIDAIKLIELIENKEFIKSINLLMIKKGSKIVNIKCIHDVYETDRPITKNFKSLNNPCFHVINGFNIESTLRGASCANCHLVMANRLLKGESFLLNKKS